MLGRVVLGSRTWIWTMAAPALAASSADSAICLGVTGTAGLRAGVSAEPVTAHEIMTLRCMVPPLHFGGFGTRRLGARVMASSVPAGRAASGAAGCLASHCALR